MHPLVEDVHRAHPIPVRPIATGATAVGAARHLVKMAAVRTRLGRVRLANLDQLYAVTTELVLSVRLQASEFQRPNILIRPPGSAVPFFVLEGPKIPRIEHGDPVSKTERHNLVRGMMQGVARHPFDFLAGTMPCAVQTLTPTRSRLRACPFFSQLGLRFGVTLLHGPQAPAGYR
jgi:hypothetical protein